ncbi:copper-transporting ATPase [Campylobacter sp. MIT 99-7217]|uniref:heavy metal translocating P-type ATPase n=1 Tax=Campylobacter sp. MIT 99-7217 TaxID=535091 RepID=UPI001157DD55|nr:cation-translocating P-type ATPase [Campylobacter sp. MIT 99-7217]TQR32439.1 copper-transporting ATPase [Campylobacter sp. MIT 99-7217]
MQEFRVKIGKMTCVNCANGIEKACKKLEGVKDSSVSYANSSGVFLVESLDLKAKIIQKINALGFEVLNDDESLDTLKIKELQKLKINLFLSIGLCLVLMYLEMFVKGDISALVQIFLAFVVVFYCGRSFFIHAFKALMNKNLDMNSLISLGSFVAFLYSLLVFFGVFEGEGFYFESAGMIIVFVLLGKFLEENAKFKADIYQKKLQSIDTKKATLIKDNEELEEISSSFVKIGDKILVKSGESVCVDGIIESDFAELDLSFLNGEFVPVVRKKGEAVLAGSVLVSSGVLVVRAEKRAIDSTLEQIRDLIFKASASKMPIARLANVISAYFVGFIIVFSVCVFGFYALKNDLNQAFLHSCAVLLISCPCALGLATPIALITALSNAARNFIFIKKPEALELLCKVKFALFDKTGTLSEEKLSVFKSNLSEENFEKLVQIESLNAHPISKALIQSAKKPLVKLEASVQSLAGKGIIYHDEDKFVAGNEKLMKEENIIIDEATRNFVRENQQEAPVLVYFAKNDLCLGVVCLKNALRADARDLIRYFEEQKITNIILSGDNEKSVENSAKALNITHFKANLSPEQKLESVRSYQKQGLSLFVGDGINDSAALALADVGIAMSSASAMAKSSGDFILIKDELSKIAYVHKLSLKTMKIIKLNLFWAFLYNILCIPIAAGFVSFISLSPHLAALAMSFSSISVVLNSLRLRKNLT